MPDHTADSALVPPIVLPPPSPPGQWDDPPESAPETSPQVEEEDELKPQQFDPRHKQPFLGLLYVGYLDDEVTVYGHKFRLATPTQTERLQIGLVIKPYSETVTGEIAYAQAVVAAFLVKVDGQKPVEPILNDSKNSELRDRFTWVGDNLRRPVIDALFDACLALDSQVEGALEAMGKAPRQPE